MKNVRFIFHFLKNRTISLDSAYNFVLKIYLIIAYDVISYFEMKRFLSAGSFVHHFKFVPNSMNIFVSTILNFVCIFYERQFKLRSSFSTCFPISFPVYQKLILSHFVARGSKHEIVPNFEKKGETNIANIT